MTKIIFGKDILKILLGFLIFHIFYNIYIAISGYLPRTPFGLGGFTMEINNLGLALGPIVISVLGYWLFFRKEAEKISKKDISKMLIGAQFIGILHGWSTENLSLIGICLILFLIFVYISFLEGK